jgi:small subunit ribosomal protein S8e
MVIVQKRSLRKPSGARYNVAPTKRLHQKGNSAAKTTVNEKRITVHRTKGGSQKNRLLSANTINAYDHTKKKFVQAKIGTVVENDANRHFVRRNIITRGAVVKTDIGNVRITSRPGQEGALNGVKVE